MVQWWSLRRTVVRGCYPANPSGKTYQSGPAWMMTVDGRIDSEDPDCLGPCDNSENGLIRPFLVATTPGARWTVTGSRTPDRATTTADHGCDPTVNGNSSPGDACAYNATMGVGGGSTWYHGAADASGDLQELYRTADSQWLRLFWLLLPGPCCCKTPTAPRPAWWLAPMTQTATLICTTKDVADPAMPSLSDGRDSVKSRADVAGALHRQ